jgi:hypothetical protein
VSAAERDDDPSADDQPQTRALVPRSVDRSLRFVGHHDRNLRHVVAWSAVGTSLLLSAPLGPTVWTLFALFGGFGTIVYGWVGAVARGHLPDRILRARALLRSQPEAAVGQLERLARAPLPAPHRLEAAGHAALLALDGGKISRAIELLDFDVGDAPAGVRARGVERGLVGELARSILAWISPGAFSQVAASPSFELSPEQREGLARPEDVDEFLDVLSLLKVLEATAATDREPALLAWRQCKDSNLRARFPGLFLIARAAAAKRLPAIRDELEHELLENHRARELLEHVFPEFSGGGGREGIYREPAVPLDGGDEADRALALVSAPEEIALAARRTASPAEFRRGTTDTMRRWLMTGAGVTASVILFGAAVGGAVGAWTASMFAAYLGAPVAVIGAIRGMRAARARLRLAPLLRLAQAVPPEWLMEFERSPLLKGSASALQHEHVLLYVACVRAEQELDEGRAFTAWKMLEWYCRGFSPERIEAASLYPVAASLVRVASLTGHLTEAQRVSDALSAARSTRDRFARTAYGSAPCALALARALMFARRGKWNDAAGQLDLAARLPGVWMSGRDEALYDLLLLVARQRTDHTLREPDRGLVMGHADWFRQVVPELFEDLGAQ